MILTVLKPVHLAVCGGVLWTLVTRWAPAVVL